ncbi:MAG: HAD-IA family hydrolase [Desulfobacula sp.]|uniref:HAD family hydrolase n=1 Tax=Desulfobacula sp. TaxID=2593537 RepID=UPI0025B93E75|nr:HAD-IA family hydrolase [Desulfobacula sp.]MCD4718468.1 HAD-IA family hydrolase [Desulfobacula sp.]
MGRTKFHGRRTGAFIFDLDGTLVNTAKDIAISANFTRIYFELPEIPEAVAVRYIGDGVEKLLQRMLCHDKRQTNPDEIVEGIAVFSEHYGNHLLDNSAPYPGVLPTLEYFRHLPIMVATNKPSEFTSKILESFNITPTFRKIVAGDDVVRKKPDPEMLIKCMKGLDIAPSDVVMVGDHPNDIIAAREYGAMSVGCLYGLVDPDVVKSEKPDLTIENFSELKTLFPSFDTLE